MVAHVFPSSFLSLMKEILSLISSSVKKGFPVIFLASSSMALSSVVDHSTLACNDSLCPFGTLDAYGSLILRVAFIVHGSFSADGTFKPCDSL